MSDLPRYQRIPDEEQGIATAKVPSLADDAEADAGPADPGSVYPPSSGGKRIELCFRPRYPCAGVREDAYGAIGRTEEVSRLRCPCLPPDYARLTSQSVMSRYAERSCR